MNEENKLIKLLIPIIAVVIIFESVVLVSNLDGNAKSAVQVSKTQEASKSTEAKPEASIIDLVFATETNQMKVGKTYKLELSMAAKDNRTIDALETYIKYDPTIVSVSALSFNNALPKPAISKIDSQNGLIKSSILVDAKPGYQINKGEVIQVLTFNITPKKVGSLNLEISTSNDSKDFATMIIESVTSKAIPFSSNKLEINCIK
jgi:hypothetical protein